MSSLDDISNLSSENVPYWENTLVATITFVVGIIGVLWNLLAMYIVMKNPLLKNSFGMLSFSHGVANTGVLVVFIIWVGPLTIIGNDELSTSRIGRHLGQINILFWDACVYSHLAVSINRLVTISFPLKVGYYLSTKNTTYILAVVWILATMHAIPYFWVEQCFIEYIPSSWTWNYAQTECGTWISTYFDYYTGVSVFAIIFCMDLVTLYKLNANNKAILNHNHSHAMTEVHHARRKTEIRFFMQTIVQEALFFYELLNFYYVYTLSSDPLYIYFTTTFAWEICHACDGLVVIIFQYRNTFRSNVGRSKLVTLTGHNHHHKNAINAW